MPTLHIALQEGFWDHEVVVRVDGREVYRQAGVRTRMQIGLADSFDVEVEAGGPLHRPPRGDAPGPEVRVEAAIGDLEESIELRPAETPFLGISLRDDRIHLRPSAAPFGYV